MAIIGLVLLIAVVPAISAPEAKAVKQKGNVTVIILDKITISDLAKAEVPNIMTLIQKGALGIMTTNPAGGESRISPNTYSTIGAGAKVAAGSAGKTAYNEDEKDLESHTLAAQEYQIRTGVKPPKGSVVHLGIAEIWNYNKDLKYDYQIGGLGTALHSAGLKTAVLGNADFNAEISREVVTIAMDRNGLVDYGDVGADLLVSDAKAVYGKRTDYDKLLDKYSELAQKANLVVVELGDLSRIDQAGTSLLPEILREKRNLALARADKFIGDVGGKMDLSKDLLLVVTPEPDSMAMEDHNFLTPVVVAGKGVNHGVLVSPTTKRPGLINNTDIVPTILNYLELPYYIPVDDQKTSLNGQPLQVKSATDPLGELTSMNDTIVQVFNSRQPLVKTFVISELVLILATVIGFYFRSPYVIYFKPLLLFVVALPLAMLWQYFIPQQTLAAAIITPLVLACVLAVLGVIIDRLWKNTDHWGSFGIIGLLTAATIIIDTFAGGTLNGTSPFSYDPMSGARFYGVGNEYMGVLIGAVLMGMGTWPGPMTKVRKYLFIALMALTTLVLIAPNLGTNVGGGIAAIIGFGVAGLLLLDLKLNYKVLGITALVLGLAFAAFLFWDMSRSPELQSHVGRTMNLLAKGGLQEAGNIIVRKWSINWRLIKGSTWSWSYFTGLASIFLLRSWFKEPGKAILKEKPVFGKMLSAVIAGSLGALFFNDSGIVAAAAMIIYGVAPYYIFFFQRQGYDEI